MNIKLQATTLEIDGYQKAMVVAIDLITKSVQFYGYKTASDDT